MSQQSLSVATDKTTLEALDPNKVDFFTFENYENWVRVWKVLDGDSVHIILIFQNHPIKLKCRLNGIDTAELESKDPEEKAYAHKAKDRLDALVSNKTLWGRCQKFDKFGRLLIDLFPISGDDTTVAATPAAAAATATGVAAASFDQKKSINQILLDEKLAYAYSGGTRLPFKEWKK